MEPANLRRCDHTPERGRLYRSGSGRVVVKRLMGPHDAVVGDVATQELAQMGLAENHDAIQALAAGGADRPLYERVLPGRPGGRDHLPEENVEGPMLDTRRGFDMDMTVVVGVCRRSLRPRTSLIRVWSLGPR